MDAAQALSAARAAMTANAVGARRRCWSPRARATDYLHLLFQASGCWGQPFSTGGSNPGSPRSSRLLQQMVSSRGTPTTSPSLDRCLDLFFINIQSSFLDVLDIHLDIHFISEYSKRIFIINF